MERSDYLDYSDIMGIGGLRSEYTYTILSPPNKSTNTMTITATMLMSFRPHHELLCGFFLPLVVFHTPPPA